MVESNSPILVDIVDYVFCVSLRVLYSQFPLFHSGISHSNHSFKKIQKDSKSFKKFQNLEMSQLICNS